MSGLDSLRVIGRVAWRLRHDLLAVLVVAAVMTRFAGSALFASAAPGSDGQAPGQEEPAAQLLITHGL